MLLKIKLDGSKAGKVDEKKSAAAAAFLKKHHTAKIIVVVDTHSLKESGAFIWSGNDPTSYVACSMKQVSILFLWKQLSLTYKTAPYRLCSKVGLPVLVKI